MGTPADWIFFRSYGYVPLVIEALFCFLAQDHCPFVFFLPQTFFQGALISFSGKWCLNIRTFLAFGVSLLTELNGKTHTHSLSNDTHMYVNICM